VSDINRKSVAQFIPLAGMLAFSLITMIKSFETGEIWRIVCSSVGFLFFLGLASLFVYSASRKIKSKKNENDA